ncbi:11597_t:CDS:10, partial [Dentiscutata heterogama]
YYAKNEPLGFFESIEEKIVNVYKRELALKGGLKHETIEIIREDQIIATIEKGYNEIIDQIEDEAIQESGWSFVRAEEYISAYHTREEAKKANRKPPHLNEIRRLRRNANIANFEGIKFPAILHDIDKFEKSNPNYAINIFKPFYRKAFRKIKVDIDPLHILERNYQVEHMIDLLYLIEGEESLNDRKNQNNILEGLKTHYKYILTCPGSNKISQCLILLKEEAKEIEADKKDKEENTKKEVEQIAVSYGYTIHCSDRTMQKLEDLEVILDKLCEIAPSGYNKIHVFDPETKKYLGASHRKYHGKKLMIQDEEKNRVIDHDYITGKFRGSAYSGCNLKLRIDLETIKIPILICNRSGYDFYHLMQEIAKVTDEKIVPIANNSEQYITFLSYDPSAEEVNEWNPHQVIEFLESYNKEKKLFLEDGDIKAIKDNHDESLNDGVLECNFHSFSVLCLLAEIKNEIGISKCDLTTQAGTSYAKYYTHEKNEELLKWYNWPSFILCLAEPWVCVLEAVYVEKPIVDLLMDLIPLIPTNIRDHAERVAQLFKALCLELIG